MLLDNKIVIITGASDGIGKQIALTLAKGHTKLSLIARSKDKLEDVCKESLKNGAASADFYVCDISNTNKLTKTINDIAKKNKGIDILINNAGIWQKMMPLDEIEASSINTLINTNMTAVIHATHASLPHMRKSEEAAIINISSKSGVTYQSGQSVYTATKHAIRGFTDVLKEDLKETNIRVAGVYQAGTNTSMFSNTGETMPINKFTDPADLANVINFMLTQPPKIWIHDIRVQF